MLSDTTIAGSKSMRKPTRLFVSYAINLILRIALFGWAVYTMFADPNALNPRTSFGFSHGIGIVNVAFVFLIVDGLKKLFPNAKIATGSLKQYRRFHAPTMRTFSGGPDELIAYLGGVRSDGSAIAAETVAGLKETALSLAHDADVLHLLPLKEEHLTASEELRRDIRRRRLREIVPVMIFWIAFNAVVAIALHFMGWLNPSTALLWTLFYFAFDMFSVVIWCPLQLFMMHNRCCTTCQIFNWDAIMVATPLVFAGGWFSLIVLVLALVVLFRWELAFVRHPERFDERTNASLRCANCKDALCYLRPPLATQKG